MHFLNNSLTSITSPNFPASSMRRSNFLSDKSNRIESVPLSLINSVQCKVVRFRKPKCCCLLLTQYEHGMFRREMVRNLLYYLLILTATLFLVIFIWVPNNISHVPSFNNPVKVDAKYKSNLYGVFLESNSDSYTFSNEKNLNESYVQYANSKREWTCKELFDGEATALKRASEWRQSNPIHDSDIAQLSSNCSELFQKFPFPLEPLTPDEAAYPLAYVILAHRNMEQLLRLLQAIYWPQNLYCLVYDKKSTKEFQAAFAKISKCLPKNIVTPSESIEIYWGHFSVLQATMNCLKLLHEIDSPWNYVQILSWSDFPLKTNAEMVRVFKIMNGNNDAELNAAQPDRFKHPVYFVPHDGKIPRAWKRLEISRNYVGYWILDRSKLKPPPPNNLTLYKGSFQASLSRDFVRFLFVDPLAYEFLEWTKDTFVPDELYFPTLIHNAQLSKIPGTFPGNCLSEFQARHQKKPWISRYDIWDRFSCGGTVVRRSCVFGVRDLKWLKSMPQLMAHKLYADFQPAALECLSELHDNRTYKGRADDDPLNMEYYQQLPNVLYHNQPGTFREEWDCMR